MAFTTGNDINILQASDAKIVGAGTGNDKYILSSSGLGEGQTITISDALGANTLQLIGGLTIASSKVGANVIQLTLSNGAIVNILGADSFSFEMGGNPLTGTAGTIQTFSEFATTSLGVTTVPSGSEVADGSANVGINTDGTTTVDGTDTTTASSEVSDAAHAAAVTAEAAAVVAATAVTDALAVQAAAVTAQAAADTQAALTDADALEVISAADAAASTAAAAAEVVAVAAATTAAANLQTAINGGDTTTINNANALKLIADSNEAAAVTTAAAAAQTATNSLAATTAATADDTAAADAATVTAAATVAATVAAAAGVTAGTAATAAAAADETAAAAFAAAAAETAATTDDAAAANAIAAAATSIAAAAEVQVSIDASVELADAAAAVVAAAVAAAEAAAAAAAAEAAAAAAQDFTLTAAATTVSEGASIAYTVTAKFAVTADTVVAFTLVAGDTAAANQGSGSTNLNDFAAGSFNPQYVTILKDATTAVFNVSATADSLTELPEVFSVQAVVDGITRTTTTSLLDGVVGSGTTFTLTTGTDNFVGTSGNDTYTASVVYDGTDVSTASTFTVADSIAGDAGTDTINLVVSGQTGAVDIPAANITGVETLNVRNTVASSASLDASNVAGLTAFNADRATGATAVTKLATGASVGMIGNGTVANGTVSYAYATATADQVINIAGGTVNTATANITATASSGVTKATINSTGAANKVDTIKLTSNSGNTVTSLTVNAATNLTATLTDSDFAATAALTVSGAAASVDLGSAFDGKTIDASGLTAGGLTIAVIATTTSFKGGQGNDVVTAAALTTTTAGIINAGAGTADVLVIANPADVENAAKGALYSNFEVLRNTRNDAVIDVSLVAGITAIQQETGGGAATFNKLTATQAANVTVRATSSKLTLALATDTGTSDVVSVTLGDATLEPTSDINTLLTVNGFETINLKAVQGKDASDHDAVVGGFVADKATALNLTGTSFDLKDVGGFAKAVVIDGSALTGYLYVAGDLVKGSSVTSGAGKDQLATTTVITGTTGDYVTYNAGTGDDKITSTLASINNTSAANGSVKIDGGTGTDTLITDAGTYIDANFQYVTNIEEMTFEGTTALNVTTGGFFITNNAATGVTFLAKQIVGATANSIDATTFTGKVTATLEQADNDAAASFSVKSGSGNDVINVSTNASLTTAATNVINTNEGNDTVTLWNHAALDAAGSFTVNLGAGNDTFVATYTGAGLLNLTGGAGVDSLTLNAVTTGGLTVNQGLGDSGTYAAANVTANAISTTTFDVITGLGTGDIVNLSSYTGGAELTSTAIAASSLSPTMVDNGYSVVKGSYSAALATFTYSSSGADSLLIVDTNVAVGATAYEAIVLVGQTAFSAATPAGVLTV